MSGIYISFFAKTILPLLFGLRVKQACQGENKCRRNTGARERDWLARGKRGVCFTVSSGGLNFLIQSPFGSPVQLSRLFLRWKERGNSVAAQPKCSFLVDVGLLDIVLSEYPYKSHNFRNLIFYDVMTLVGYSAGFLIFLNPRLDLQIGQDKDKDRIIYK